MRTLALVLCVAGCASSGGGASNGGGSEDATGVEDVFVDAPDVEASPDPGAVDAGSDTAAEDAAPDVAPPPDTAGAEDIGPKCDCDDGEPCTKDVCHADGSCEHLPLTTPECKPSIVITLPARAATVAEGVAVTVEGSAVVPLGSPEHVTISGTAVPLNPSGFFSESFFPEHGVNVLAAEVTDATGAKARAVQALLAAEGFYTTTEGPTSNAKVTNGLVVYLGQDVWDDDDTGDSDDVATLAGLILENIDIVSYLPVPITGKGEAPGALWCEWSVTVNDISYKVQSVDLVPMPGGLALAAKFTGIVVDFTAVAPDFLCPDAGGTATSASASIVASLDVWLSGGKAKVEVATVDVTLAKPDFNLTYGFASYFGWLADWFSGTLAGKLETAVEDALTDKLTPFIEGMLAKLSSYQTTVSIPALPGGSGAVPVTVAVSPSLVNFIAGGAIVGLAISATTPQFGSWLSSPGSIGRNGCYPGEEPPLEVPTAAPMTLAVHDDLVNEALFAAWWGGALNLKIGKDQLAALKVKLPIDGLEVTVDPWLPPVFNTCKDGGIQELQVGDLRLLATFDVGGQPAALEAFVSAAFDVSLTAAAGEGGTLDLGIKVESLATFEFEVVSTTGAISGTEDVIGQLLSTVVTDVIVGALAKGFMKSFPIPKVDLGTKIPGVPKGTTLGFEPTSLKREDGFLVLSGQIAD